jgi:hypothetical protein
MQTWIKGLIAAVITGVANAFLAAVVSPETFNTSPEGLKKLGLMLLLSGGIGAATYLKQSPIPPSVPPAPPAGG